MSQKVKLVGKSAKAFIEWELRDPQGRIVKRGKQPVKSWVRAWIAHLYAAFGQANINSNDTGGSSRLVDYAYPARMNASAGDTARGIVAGASDTPVTRDDYKLGSQISHGNASGQLMYSAMSWDSPVAYGTGYLIRGIRVFTNNSGGDVTVKEIGCYASIGNYYFCLIRDVLSTPVTVPNGYSWTVRYNFYFVV
jgi:hypothetical protein